MTRPDVIPDGYQELQIGMLKGGPRDGEYWITVGDESEVYTLPVPYPAEFISRDTTLYNGVRAHYVRSEEHIYGVPNNVPRAALPQIWIQCQMLYSVFDFQGETDGFL